MTKEQKIEKIEILKKEAAGLKKIVDYQNALQTALKLVLNGSYGAFATEYFILYNNHVASSITAQGRNLTQTMNAVNEEYWYNQWHLDKELHFKLCIKNIKQVVKSKDVSIYADTDSLFVSFKPAIDNCEWKNLFFNNLDRLIKSHVIIKGKEDIKTDNPNCLGIFEFDEKSQELIDAVNQAEFVLVDGKYIKNRSFEAFIKTHSLADKLRWNWAYELDFIQGLDYYRYAGYFKKCLEEYAESYGVDNKEDFELERISESVIYLAKKKYIQHIVHEDGINYDRLNYIYPKGVELVRSSTPAFAREKIMDVIKYLFAHPDTFTIKELLKLVKNLKREFDLCVPDKIDDICMQSSCSNYHEKVINDKDKLEFVSGAHFAVKASAYYNYLLNKNKELQDKYEPVKSGSKIKYYYTKNSTLNNVFAYMRGSYPIEFAPEIDLDEQFDKCILSPINSILEPLKMPEITKRLSVVLDIFGSSLAKKREKTQEEKEQEEDDERNKLWD